MAAPAVVTELKEATTMHACPHRCSLGRAGQPSMRLPVDADASALPIWRTRLEDFGRLQMEPASCGDESSEKERKMAGRRQQRFLKKRVRGTWLVGASKNVCERVRYDQMGSNVVWAAERCP